MHTNRRTQCCNREMVEEDMMRRRCTHQGYLEVQKGHIAKDMEDTKQLMSQKILFKKHSG